MGLTISYNEHMKILVLGGTGTMGKDLVNFLASRKEEVYVTSRRQRMSNDENIHYIQADAMNIETIAGLLETHYDCVVDFMYYKTNQFQERAETLLGNTEQYIFLSSCRVYAESKGIITEDSPRLLDVSTDTDFLATDEYPLAKAREENILIESGKNNWTIVRPYITYNSDKLQMGFYEKEMWLSRLLESRTIVFPNDIKSQQTTMMHGRDVAQAICDIIGKSNCYGQIYNISYNGDRMTWGEVLNVYINVFEQVTGIHPKIQYVDNCEEIAYVSKRKYQAIYDRLYNRAFDSEKIASVSPNIKDAISMKEGLEKALVDFLNGPRIFGPRNWVYEGYIDRVAHEHTSLALVQGYKNKIKYSLARYAGIYM